MEAAERVGGGDPSAAAAGMSERGTTRIRALSDVIASTQ